MGLITACLMRKFRYHSLSCCAFKAMEPATEQFAPQDDTYHDEAKSERFLDLIPIEKFRNFLPGWRAVSSEASRYRDYYGTLV